MSDGEDDRPQGGSLQEDRSRDEAAGGVGSGLQEDGGDGGEASQITADLLYRRLPGSFSYPGSRICTVRHLADNPGFAGRYQIRGVDEHGKGHLWSVLLAADWSGQESRHLAVNIRCEQFEIFLQTGSTVHLRPAPRR